jgi:hypothetical protein
MDSACIGVVGAVFIVPETCRRRSLLVGNAAMVVPDMSTCILRPEKKQSRGCNAHTLPICVCVVS